MSRQTLMLRTFALLMVCTLGNSIGRFTLAQSLDGKPDLPSLAPGIQYIFVEFEQIEPIVLTTNQGGSLLWEVIDIPPGAQVTTAGEHSSTFAMSVDMVGTYDVRLTSTGPTITQTFFSVNTESSLLNGPLETAEAVPSLTRWGQAAAVFLLMCASLLILNRRANSRLAAALVLAALSFSWAPPAYAVFKINGTEIAETSENYQDFIKFLTVPPERQNDPAFGGSDINAIKALEDPIRREIYDKMQGSTEPFDFRNLDAAKDNWRMRIEAIDLMRKMNVGQIRFGYYDPHVKPQVPASVASVKWQTNQRPYITWQFKLKAGENAFDGINDLLATQTRGECSGAITACLLGAAAKVKGKDAFNQIHGPGSLVLGWSNKEKNVFASGDRHLKLGEDTATHIPGDYVYIKNKSDYTEKTRQRGKQGFWTGENTLYIGGGKYSGLGLDDKTEDDLRAELKAHYEEDTDIRPFPGNANTEIVFAAPYRLKVEP